MHRECHVFICPSYNHLKILPELPDEKISQTGQCIVLLKNKKQKNNLNHMVAIERWYAKMNSGQSVFCHFILS